MSTTNSFRPVHHIATPILHGLTHDYPDLSCGASEYFTYVAADTHSNREKITYPTQTCLTPEHTSAQHPLCTCFTTARASADDADEDTILPNIILAA